LPFCQVQSGDGGIFTVHSRKISPGQNIIHPDYPAAPQGFCGIVVGDVFPIHTIALPKVLELLNQTVFYLNVIGLPESGPDHFRQLLPLIRIADVHQTGRFYFPRVISGTSGWFSGEEGNSIRQLRPPFFAA